MAFSVPPATALRVLRTPSLSTLPVSRHPRLRQLICQPVQAAGKGFSKKARQAKKNKRADKEGGSKQKQKRVKFKGKKTARGLSSAPVPQRPVATEPPKFQLNESPEDAKVEEIDIDFEKRLAVVAMDGKQRKEEKVEQQKSIFEGDIYSNPPPLSQTLTGKTSDEDYEGGSFGPGQAAIAGISIFAVVAFAATSLNSDTVMSTPQAESSASRSRREKEFENKQAQESAKKFEAALAEKPDDLEALEGAAVSYAQMGSYDKAVPKLKELAAKRPDDPDTLRLLAETQVGSKDYRSAIDTYRKAEAASPRSRLEILQGLSSTLVKDGQEAKGIDEVRSAREKVESGTREADYSPYEADLLMASLYSQWSGHNSDALKVYDALIKSDAEDFRAYLAKGVLLRSNGQKGDAERMFIQAKYLAPQEVMSVVNRVIGQQ